MKSLDDSFVERLLRFALVLGIIRLASADVVMADDSVRVVRDVTYVQRAERALAADVYLPDCPGPHPTVLMLHGGAWAAGHKSHSAWHARRLASVGYAAVAIDYRLAPDHLFPAQLRDCQEALRWTLRQAKRFALDADRLAAFGYSAGGHLACLLAMTDRQDSSDTLSPRLRAVVAGGAPCEFRAVPPDSRQYVFWLGGTRREKPDVYRHASPAHFANRRAPPVFFFHGDSDRLVPKRDPLDLHDRLRQLGVASELYLVPKAGHLGAYVDTTAMDRAVKFLNKHLRHAPGESP